MKIFVAKLESISPHAQSRYHGTPELEKELPKDYEARTWREKAHINKDGFLIITDQMFKNSLSEGAKYLSQKIPGKGKSTYTKHFEAGVAVKDALITHVKKEDLIPLWLFVPADGKRGGARRVHKCFPMIYEWKGLVTYFIWDDIISKDVFVHHLVEAGKFVGAGMSRPRNNGNFGRWKVLDVKQN